MDERADSRVLIVLLVTVHRISKDGNIDVRESTNQIRKRPESYKEELAQDALLCHTDHAFFLRKDLPSNVCAGYFIDKLLSKPIVQS